MSSVIDLPAPAATAARCYDELVATAADDLERTIRRSANPRGVMVWAIPTTPADKGRLVVGTEPPATPPGVWPVVVWPSDNGASAHASWVVVPFSAMRHVLWHACRRQPIL